MNLNPIHHFRAIRHWLAHWLGWNTGHIVTRTTPQGKILVGFQCRTCGKITDIHPSHLRLMPPPGQDPLDIPPPATPLDF